MKLRFLWMLPLVLSLEARAANRKDFDSVGYTKQPTKIWTEASAKFGSPIAELEEGVELEVLTYSTTRSWAKVRTPEGREGWIPVMHTSFAGPKNATSGKETSVADAAEAEGEEGPNREIASVGGMKPIVSKKKGSKGGGKKPASADSDTRFAGKLEYLNELSREAASGAGLGLAVGTRLGESWWVGGGVDYHFSRETALGTVERVTRMTHKFFPHALLEYQHGSFVAELGLGAEFDHTGISSYNLYNAPIGSNSDTSTALGIKVTPRYLIAMDSGYFFSVHMLYKMTIDLGSGTGSGFTVMDPVGRVQHVLGAGLGITWPL